jgi:thioesterase domain-containing protein
VSLPPDHIARDQLGLSSPLVAPRNRIESRLAEIWQGELKVCPIGVEDDYYELGGGSLEGIQIFLRIEQEFGKRLPLAALVEQPTIARIAALIGAAGASPWSCLVGLKPEGTLPPLFCIHDSSGNVVVYRQLAGLLEQGQPVYGLQYPDQDKSPLEALSIAAQAARYVAEIRRRQPRGPYYLAGYSIGGLIAFEIARQLTAAGQQVALLAMLDAFAPDFPAQGLGKLVDHALELCRRPPWAWPAWFRRRAAYRISRTAERRRLYDGGRSVLYQIECRILPEARRAYVPEPYPGRIDLFRCAEDRMLWHRRPELGWAGLAEGGIVIHDIAATHQNLLAAPAVAEVARHLTACIAAASTRAKAA